MPASATSPRGRRVLENGLQGALDPCPPSGAGVRGFSLVESLLVLGLLALTAAIALPSILRGLDDARAVAAARYVAALARLTRVQAATRLINVGLRF
jgi:prepilin-type N-terminal cleavage/methylation domain-containing protein